MKLKFNFKNLFLFLMILVFSSMRPLNSHAFAKSYTPDNLALESSSGQQSGESENTEDSGVFDFIKSNDNVKDFFYDGSALLYGGILLILISAFGIFKTLKPKKKKRSRKNTATNKKDN